MKKNALLSVLAIAGIIGCASVKKQPNPYEGTWILKQQSGGFAGKTTSPKEEIKLIIKNDKISRYENGQLLSEEEFKTEKGKTIQSSEPKDLIVSSHLRKQSIEQKGDTLIIAEQCYDCFTFLYVRNN